MGVCDEAGNLVKLVNNTGNAPVSALSTETVAFSHYDNISAQLPIDPKTGIVVTGGVSEQAGQCLFNIKAILESMGHAMADVVKIHVFLRNMADSAAVNEVCAPYFQGAAPAGRVVGVSALPKNALIQIDAVASYAEGTAR